MFKLRFILFLAIGSICLSGCLNEGFDASSELSNTPTTTPQPPSGLTPAIMAVGHKGSSMYTCDGGETWKGYREMDDVRCYDANNGNIDCNHHSGAAMGVTWGEGGFLVTYGWGSPGAVEISADGENWDTVDSGSTWAGVAYGNGTYILNSRKPLISNNNGETWESGGDLNFIPWNARKIFFIDQPMEQTFLSTANSSGVNDLMISKDYGATFYRPSILPASCGNGTITYSPTKILLFSTDLCVSDDYGETWQIIPNKPSGTSPIYDGQSFKIFDPGVVRSSVDGITWQDTAFSLNGVASPGLRIPIVLYHPALDRYVGIYQAWGNWYEHTQYYYSDDGINWIRVDKESGAAPIRPHSIRATTIGYLEDCN